jgi:hypothetical protein
LVPRRRLRRRDGKPLIFLEELPLGGALVTQFRLPFQWAP